MKKIKNIYLTKERMEGMTNYSTGLIFLCEDGDIYEATSSDVMEQITKSKLTIDDLDETRS